MSVAFDKVVSASNNGGASLSTPTMAPAGADRYLLCGIAISVGQTVTTCKKAVGGAAFTQIAALEDAVGGERIELFELKNPTTAAEVIEVVLSDADGGFIVGCCSFNGVDQTTPIQTNETASGAGDPTRTITSAVGNFCMMVFSLMRDLNYTATAGTERWDLSGDKPAGGGITEPGAASTTMTANYAQNRPWVLAAVSIAAAAGAGLGIPVTMYHHMHHNLV